MMIFFPDFKHKTKMDEILFELKHILELVEFLSNLTRQVNG